MIRKSTEGQWSLKHFTITTVVSFSSEESLYEGEYDKMMNFILEIHYQNRRSDFNARAQFSNTANSKYFSNADTLLKSLTGYIETL